VPFPGRSERQSPGCEVEEGFKAYKDLINYPVYKLSINAFIPTPPSHLAKYLQKDATNVF
jgi:hypothetical protein